MATLLPLIVDYRDDRHPRAPFHVLTVCELSAGQLVARARVGPLRMILSRTSRTIGNTAISTVNAAAAVGRPPKSLLTPLCCI